MSFSAKYFSSSVTGVSSYGTTNGTFTASISDASGTLSGSWSFNGTYSDPLEANANGSISFSGSLTGTQYWNSANYAEWNVHYQSSDSRLQPSGHGTTWGDLLLEKGTGKFSLDLALVFDVTYLSKWGYTASDTFAVGANPPLSPSAPPLPPIISIDQYPGYVLEDDGAGPTYTLTLKRSGILADDSTVTIQLKDGAAVSTGSSPDYAPFSNNQLEVTFNPGETSRTVTFVTISPDTTVENNENFGIKLVNPVNATLGFSTGNVVIYDNDGGRIVHKGDSGNDVVTGLGGNDALDGGGGSNTISGGNGDDTITVGKGLTLSSGTNALDGGAGNDTITGGSGDDTLTGGEGDDKLTGGAGNDTLDGGNGKDKLAGGDGNDTYTISDLDVTGTKAADVVTEGGGINSGTLDTVNSTISYTLTTNVEILNLLGTGNIDGTGNKGNNTITGNSGDNKLNGKEGSDTLTGNGGNDTFVFDTKIATDKKTNQPTNSDHITDFISGTDDIDLSVKVFSVYKTAFDTANATSGKVDLSGSFDSGAGLTTASSADIHFIYNTSTGNLYYDADGSGTKKAAIQFATLDGHPALQASDLHIFG